MDDLEDLLEGGSELDDLDFEDLLDEFDESSKPNQ